MLTFPFYNGGNREVYLDKDYQRCRVKIWTQICQLHTTPGDLHGVPMWGEGQRLAGMISWEEWRGEHSWEGEVIKNTHVSVSLLKITPFVGGFLSFFFFLLNAGNTSVNLKDNYNHPIIRSLLGNRQMAVSPGADWSDYAVEIVNTRTVGCLWEILV